MTKRQAWVTPVIVPLSHVKNANNGVGNTTVDGWTVTQTTDGDNISVPNSFS